jgi:predicted dehydrogenase
LINFLHATPDSVEGTILNKVFSSDVDDEVYATFRFPSGATGQLAANWSDDSFRKMSMEITIWGSNGRMRIDRQEIQIYLKESQASFPKLQRGWNLHYTTELTEPVWFYLRGEEYSMQLDHFARCINDQDVEQVSSFETALATDIVLGEMLENANRVRACATRMSSSSSRFSTAFSNRVSASVKSLFASHNPSE